MTNVKGKGQLWKNVNSELTTIQFHEIFPCSAVLQKTHQLKAGNVSISRDFSVFCNSSENLSTQSWQRFNFTKNFSVFCNSFFRKLVKSKLAMFTMFQFHEIFSCSAILQKTRQLKADNVSIWRILNVFGNSTENSPTQSWQCFNLTKFFRDLLYNSSENSSTHNWQVSIWQKIFSVPQFFRKPVNLELTTFRVH